MSLIDRAMPTNTKRRQNTSYKCQKRPRDLPGIPENETQKMRGAAEVGVGRNRKRNSTAWSKLARMKFGLLQNSHSQKLSNLGGLGVGGRELKIEFNVLVISEGLG